MKASLSINLFLCGSDNECPNNINSESSIGSNNNLGNSTHDISNSKKNGYDNGFNSNKKSQVEYNVQVKCKPYGNDEQLHFCEVYSYWLWVLVEKEKAGDREIEAIKTLVESGALKDMRTFVRTAEAEVVRTSGVQRAPPNRW